MAADLREMQENQWVSEIRIDKSRFVEIIISDNARYGKKKRDPDRIIIRVPLWEITLILIPNAPHVLRGVHFFRSRGATL